MSKRSSGVWERRNLSKTFIATDSPVIMWVPKKTLPKAPLPISVPKE